MSICITGMGVVSPGGYNTEQNYTTIHAGISPLSESEEFAYKNSDGFKIPVVCGAAIGITDGQRRYLRQLRLARFACQQSLDQAGLDVTALKRTSMYLCFQEQFRPGMDDRHEQLLAKHLARDLYLNDLAERTRTISIGHAGVFWAINAASQDIVRGVCNIAIIGAVDTYLDDITLEWLFDLKRLKNLDQPGGFIPSEGAGFLVVESAASAQARGVPALVKLSAPATAMEGNSFYHEDPCKGDGLTESLRSTIAQAGDSASSIGMVVCDLNGERYRATEWGFALARAMGGVKSDYRLIHPADCIGDTGAASGVINACYAASAIADGVVTGGTVLQWGSSDDGERGAMLLSVA
jgi:3-oxoacyl-[acyl-carrier-protein] synthase-1